MLEKDAELGIDRETTDLVTMLEEKGIRIICIWTKRMLNL